MRASRASGHHRMVGTLQAVLDRHITRGKIDQTPGNEEWRYLARAALLEKQRRIGDAGEAADPGANHRAGGAAILFSGRMPIGVIERLARRAITQAIRQVRSETSNVSIFLAPLSLLRMRFQVGSTPQPSGDTMPRPVTTTRLISSTPARDLPPTTRNRWTVRPRPVRLPRRHAGGSAFRVLF